MGNKSRFHADIMDAHSEVTGSCHMVSVTFPDDTSMLFITDFGLYQERAYDKLNAEVPFKAHNVDFALVTHNHVDHTGRLPILSKGGFDGKIYMTETTAKLLPLALYDSYKVLHENSKRRNCKELYSEQNVSDTLKMVQPCPFNQTIKVNERVRITFLSNGHLIGAAMILVQIRFPKYEDINILFTGDYCNKNMFFRVKSVPKWIRELPLTIVQESTYGTTDSTSIEPCFKKNVMECLKEGGSVIAPVFSLGRSQEILYELKCMQEWGDIDLSIPIYLDGKLAIKYTKLFLEDELDISPMMRNFTPQNLIYVDKASRDEVLHNHDPKIILTTSGMGSYGPAQVYIPEYITRKKCLIHFTGYTSEGTLGAELKDAADGEAVEVCGIVVKKKARVEYTREYSAHAKADEMIDFLQQFSNVNLILVNHGNTDVKTAFAKRIVNEVDVKKVAILNREYFYRINAYGLIKSIPTKFK